MTDHEKIAVRQMGSGFHPRDPDYTRGRGMALRAAEGIARMQEAMARHVVSLLDDSAICEGADHD